MTTKISKYKFDKDTSQNFLIKSDSKFHNWPVVYIINNDKDAYVGETTNISKRVSDHWKSNEKNYMNIINLIINDTFNKSSILDLESFLIKYMSSDGKYNLINKNNGLQNHNYFKKEEYNELFKKIWDLLIEKKLVKNSLEFLQNSSLFKFSPYKSLTYDQFSILHFVLDNLSEDIENNKRSSIFVNGGPGTGKTILGIYLMKLLADANKSDYFYEDEKEEHIINVPSNLHNLKITFVVSMTNFRETLEDVFDHVDGLNKKMVIKPSDVANIEDEYDLLIVDEAHRLRRRVNVPDNNTFKKTNIKLYGKNLDKNQLDWIVKKSKHQIFFYDDKQSVKPTDIRKNDFNNLLLKNLNDDNYIVHTHDLKGQIRCIFGGDEYIEYIRDIMSNKESIEIKSFEGLVLYSDPNKMIDDIRSLDKEYGMCRVLAGYAWDWNSKNNVSKILKSKKRNEKYLMPSDIDRIIKNGNYDIELDGKKYIWNECISRWNDKPYSNLEIGCIHTSQGFDYNYAGVIIGDELTYNKETRMIEVISKNLKDKNVKRGINDDELLEYVFNSYSTMLTRGMRGTFVYIKDTNLKEHLEKYFTNKK